MENSNLRPPHAAKFYNRFGTGLSPEQFAERRLRYQLDTAWMRAQTKSPAFAYRAIRKIVNNARRRYFPVWIRIQDAIAQSCWRLFWILARYPELDPSRQPLSWLIRALRAKPSHERIRETLYLIFMIDKARWDDPVRLDLIREATLAAPATIWWETRWRAAERAGELASAMKEDMNWTFEQSDHLSLESLFAIHCGAYRMVRFAFGRSTEHRRLEQKLQKHIVEMAGTGEFAVPSEFEQLLGISREWEKIVAEGLDPLLMATVRQLALEEPQLLLAPLHRLLQKAGRDLLQLESQMARLEERAPQLTRFVCERLQQVLEFVSRRTAETSKDSNKESSSRSGSESARAFALREQGAAAETLPSQIAHLVDRINSHLDQLAERSPKLRITSFAPSELGN